MHTHTMHMDPFYIIRAYDDARFYHRDQVDKGGNAYIHHVVGVMRNASKHGINHCIVALLHDIVEDTECTLDQIRATYSEEIADAVEAITHLPGEDYWDYINRVSGNEIARLVKLADLEHNMSPERVLPDAKWQARAMTRYQRAVDLLS